MSDGPGLSLDVGGNNCPEFISGRRLSSSICIGCAAKTQSCSSICAQISTTTNAHTEGILSCHTAGSVSDICVIHEASQALRILRCRVCVQCLKK